ncbi:MAG: LTA synthase family protein [Dorea sp.]|nr:LTA synthase family protein [Dorea sp.]
MLMSDFMFELKKVRYIIDNGIAGGENSGFEIIKESKILDAQIDGVIISSRIYKDEIVDRLKANFNGIKYLDIYEEFDKEGIHLDRDYYDREHPYSKYRKLNQHQRKLVEFKDSQSRRTVLKKIIKSYIEIKDFQSAIRYTEKLIQESGDEWDETLLVRLKEIYELQLEATEKIHENNVVMLCIDGLRRKDVTEQTMKNLSAYIREKMYYFDNAYSVSTSTYESLIPAYSENDDLRTGYFQENWILGDKCRFIKEAKKQRRKIFFYTDGTEYVVDDEIHVTPYSQTATEKLWDFLLDAVDEHNGLFYVHILYESHFAYPNPYTMETIVGEGTSILFDFLEKNGGRLQADYVMQQKDALRYLDDTAVPLIERLHCGIVLYADHGNILLGRETGLRDIENTKYTFHEDLIQVPLAVGYPGIATGIDRRLISIMELNNIVNMLMKREKYLPEKKEFIKILRSEIYNPDFRYLYKLINYERGLEAFEVFIFKDGYKLAVYADGSLELYLAETDREIDDIVIKKRLLDQVRDYITVCEQMQTA